MKKTIKKFWKVTTEDGDVMVAKSAKTPKFAVKMNWESTQYRPAKQQTMSALGRLMEARPDLPVVPVTGYGLYERRKDAKAAVENCSTAIGALPPIAQQPFAWVPIKNRQVIKVTATEITKDEYLAAKKRLSEENRRLHARTGIHGTATRVFDCNGYGDGIATAARVNERRARVY